MTAATLTNTKRSKERDRTAIKVADGVLVSVPNRIDLMTTYVLREQEDWFEDEIAFIRYVTRKGTNALDIGANYGLYSLALARAVGEQGRVWSVEPCTATASHLSESASLNAFANMTVVQTALSNRDGTARLQLDNNSELNALTENVTASGASEEVTLTSLDQFAREHGCAGIDFVKMDAEGEEERIIEGGSTFFDSESPLVMYEIKHGNQLKLGLVDAFSTCDYATYRLIPGLNLLAPFDVSANLEPYQLNLFCCKPDRAELLAGEGVLARERAAEPGGIEMQNWWRDDLSARTFAQNFRADWLRSSGAKIPGRTELEWVLALYGEAHDNKRSATERYGALRFAFKRIEQLCAGSNDVFRLSTYARIAREMGERQAALAVLGRALNIVMKSDPGMPAEPFLPASQGFERIDPGTRVWQWTIASMLDAAITWYTFSTYFAPPTLLQDLELLKSTGFQRPEMERRRQLMRMRTGQQTQPEAVPSLVIAHPDNRNPRYWSGAVV